MHKRLCNVLDIEICCCRHAAGLGKGEPKLGKRLTWHKVTGVHTLIELHLSPEAVLVSKKLADHWGVVAAPLG